MTSYSTRTSPTIRGKWLLENILAAPVPPPPPNVNTNLDESKLGKPHRCARCWSSIAPTRCAHLSCAHGSAGLQPRELRRDRPVAHDRRGRPINATGVLLDGTKVDGPAALRPALVAQKEQFVRTVTGKLLTYAIRPRDRVLRSRRPSARSCAAAAGRLPLVVDDSGDRQERSVSDEEIAVMIVTKKAISRRTVLRGMGAAVALPLLDAMVPALTAQVKTPAKPVRRLGVVYHPNGVIYENWLPKGTGRRFRVLATLAPLEPFRDQLIVVTGLSSHQAEALGDGGGDHSRASGRI